MNGQHYFQLTSCKTWNMHSTCLKRHWINHPGKQHVTEAAWILEHRELLVFQQRVENMTLTELRREVLPCIKSQNFLAWGFLSSRDLHNWLGYRWPVWCTQAWLILQIFQSWAAVEREARALMLGWICLLVSELQRDCCAETRGHLKARQSPNRSDIQTEIWLCCSGIPGLIPQLLLQISGLGSIFSSSVSIPPK